MFAIKPRWKFFAQTLFFVFVIVGSAQSETPQPILDPTTFHFAPSHSETTVLHLFNNEDVAVEWSAQSFKWTQDASGKDQLAPTSEISVSPGATRLQPHTGQEIQISYGGDEAPQTEKTFRVVLTSSAIGTGDVKADYSYSLPVFIDVAKPSTEFAIYLTTPTEGRIAVDVSNLGNMHDYATEISLVGLDTGGSQVFAIDRASWYILAGKTLRYQVIVAEKDCRKSASFNSVVTFRSGIVKQSTLSGQIKCQKEPSQRTDFEDLMSSELEPAPASPDNDKPAP